MSTRPRGEPRALGVVLALLVLVVAEHGEVHLLDDDALDAVNQGLGEGDGKISKILISKNHKMKATKKDPMLGKLMGKIAVNKPVGPMKPHDPREYSKIPNFVVQGTPVNKILSRDLCMKRCDAHKECRSYSWRQKDKKCFWSTGTLRYNHEWEFYSKDIQLNALGQMSPTGNFAKFDGLFAMDRDINMKTYKDKNRAECKEICRDEKTCHSFSFHEGDHACLISKSKIMYSKGFDYFERNKPPKKKNGDWEPYPYKLDAYHKAKVDEEKKTLQLFAERDKKSRMKKDKKAERKNKQAAYMEAKEKRLAKEAKAKIYAREQHQKMQKAEKKEREVDQKAATEKGKFDEAFHKNTKKNKELLHKGKAENRAKAEEKSREKAKKAKDMKEFELHLQRVKERGHKEMTMKNNVIIGKERGIKLARAKRAEAMKTEAFALVRKERKYKSGVVFDGESKKYKGKRNKIVQKLWINKDEQMKQSVAEKRIKNKLKVAASERKLKEKGEKMMAKAGAKPVRI